MEHLPIFVYGTLQRGEERAPRWPCLPRLVEWATVRGCLHDLGLYPALVEGNDCVLGELWHLEAADLPVTLEVLDAIECYGQDDVDLYVRRTITCTTALGHPQRAYVYFFANPDEIAATRRVRPNTEGICHWRSAK